jgi:M6 family metalloprotease-like protein
MTKRVNHAALTALLLLAVAARGSRPASAQDSIRGQPGQTAPADRTGLKREASSTAAKQVLERRQAERVGGTAVRAPRLVTRLLPVILVDFEKPRIKFRHPETAYASLLFGDANAPNDGGPMTMRAYFRDNSGGLFDLRGRILGWYQAHGQDADYPFEAAKEGRPGFGNLLKEMLTAADKAVDFGQFDNDGPDGKPNSGDDDGVVDTVIFIHNGIGAECGGPDASSFASHSYRYDSQQLGHELPFPTRSIRRDALGEALLAPDGTEQPIVVRDYILQAGLSCEASENKKPEGQLGKDKPPKLMEIGSLCHQYGHVLGLPDLHDRTPSGQPDSNGVGVYCLMSHGATGGNREARPHAERPTALSAWCKHFLGWADAETIRKSGTYPLTAVAESNRVYRIVVPKTDGLEYFLIEYRKNDWTDPVGGRTNWDAGLPGSGLLVWHIDERVGNGQPSWPFAAFDSGQNDSPSRPKDLRDPADQRPTEYEPKHALVALVQADGRFDLEQARNLGDEGDFFKTGTKLTDTATLQQSTRGYFNNPSRFSITDINLRAQVFQVQFEGDSPNLAAQVPYPVPPVPPLRGPLADLEASARRLLALDDSAREAFRAVAVSDRYTRPLQNPPNELPAAFDWRQQGVVTPVHDQGQCDSAWVFAALGAFESAYAVRNGWLIDSSEQYVMNCGSKGDACSGGWYTTALDFLVANGVTSDRVIPYQGEPHPCLPGTVAPYRAVAWGFVNPITPEKPSVDEIKKKLYEFGPLVCALSVTDAFEAYKPTDGVYNEKDEIPALNHAGVIVGWDDLKPWKSRDGVEHRGAWIVKNSWGTDWGRDGYVEIAYGSNLIGSYAAWVRAASVAFQPDLVEFKKVVPGARAFEPIPSEFDPSPGMLRLIDDRQQRAESLLRTEFGRTLEKLQLSGEVTQRNAQVNVPVPIGDLRVNTTSQLTYAISARFVALERELKLGTVSLSAKDPSTLRLGIMASAPVEGTVSKRKANETPFQAKMTAFFEIEADLLWSELRDPPGYAYVPKITRLKVGAEKLRYTLDLKSIPSEAAALLSSSGDLWLDPERNKLRDPITEILSRVFRDPKLRVPPLALVK